jgi:hypothetical protein
MIDRRAVAADNAADRLRSRCPASTGVTTAECARLDALPSTLGPPSPSIGCELAAGHDGSHLAFAVAACGGERWWWLRWGTDHRTLTEADTCDRTQDDGPQRDDCLLPRDHPGPHSYQIRATP